MYSSLSIEASTMAEQFVSASLVVPVTDAGMSEPGLLRVSRDHPEKREKLRKSAETCMRAVGHPDRTGDLLEGFLTNNLKHDLWYVRVKNGPTIILVRENIYRQISELEIIEQVHKEEVECAVQRGETVPDDLLRYLRGISRPKFTTQSQA